jgi:DNA-binding response OmpR family regulator
MTTILLVDDAPEIRDVMTVVLNDEGFDVTACDRVDEALNLLAPSLPDLLILDGRLPGMSGWEFLGLLRASVRTARLPVLILSAAAEELHRNTQNPADDCTSYLTKPFDIDALLATIQDLLKTCDQYPVTA